MNTIITQFSQLKVTSGGKCQLYTLHTQQVCQYYHYSQNLPPTTQNKVYTYIYRIFTYSFRNRRHLHSKTHKHIQTYLQNLFHLSLLNTILFVMKLTVQNQEVQNQCEALRMYKCIIYRHANSEIQLYYNEVVSKQNTHTYFIQITIYLLVLSLSNLSYSQGSHQAQSHYNINLQIQVKLSMV
eukprot:TRINITY_DN61268_c0_g1_i1.p2 TRINITY_DN61268_c0_g1~~TRINITY_DN61268_c0_g1_i1.p2  ORF type:complete len:204 (+),score=-23.21 TRINITY_DN61268_c0_g1_i1:64-612(+)